MTPAVRLGFTTLVCSAAALAHYTWIAAPALEPGKTVTLTIGHGHHFPESEEAINARQLDLFAVAPSGAKSKLDATGGAGAVTASFTPREHGTYRIAFVQDRGVTSRTPAGAKPGGRDKNPTATQASRTLRTAVSYTPVGSSVTAGQALGLEIELTAAPSGNGWELQLLKQGKPAAGATVEVFAAGAGKAVEAGKTGADGKVTVKADAAWKGPLLFSVALKDPAPAGAPYDFVNYETSLTVAR